MNFPWLPPRPDPQISGVSLRSSAGSPWFCPNLLAGRSGAGWPIHSAHNTLWLLLKEQQRLGRERLHGSRSAIRDTLSRRS
jgi:hypothetical protein